MNKPVLFITFNRFDTAEKVFEQIRIAKPPRLYFASDGARENVEGEKEKIEEIREWILNHIDWDCEVKTRFLDKNSGCCTKAVTGAINWFFENEECGIILEDDCVPSQSFFPYCEELLEKYKNDKRVWHITGYGYYKDEKAKDTYYFAKIQHCWGWASWADRWKHFTLDLSNYDEKNLKKFSKRKEVQEYMRRILNAMNKDPDMWDWKWSFIIVANNGLCCNPYKNLISNIGVFGTHYKGNGGDDLNTETFELEGEIKHPRRMCFNKKAVDYIYTYHYQIAKVRKKLNLKPFIQKAFSIKDEYSNKTKRKVITFMGIKMKFKTS